MNYLFKGCSKLTVLDLSTFDTSKVTYSSGMFDGCTNLMTLYISSTMGNISPEACNDIGTPQKPCTIIAPDGFNFGIDTSGDYFIWKGGFFRLNPMAPYAQLYNGTLHFYYDREKASRPGTVYSIPTTATTPEWATSASSVTKVIFDASFEDARPTSTYQWFDSMTNLASINGLEYLNTSEVTSMYCMFNKCAKLQKLDLSHFDTRKVTSMTAMMANCTNLKEVNLEGLDTSSATTIRMMFQNCSSLTSVDLSSFDLTKCTDIRKLFEGCTSLEAVDFSNFNVQPGTNTTNLLYNCSALKTLILSDSMEDINSTACKGVGTASNPCVVSAPSTFDFGVDTSANSFLWKGGYFQIATPFDTGDVNHDGVVNVTDVMATIQYILGTNPPNYDESLADMNNDGNIDVTDAMAMVLVILDSNVSGAPACAITSYETLTLAPNANGFDITTAGVFTACQMTVTIPEGGTISNVSTTAGGKAFVKKIADNRYNVVVYSQEGMPLTKDGAFIQLRTRGNTNGISIDNIQLTDRTLNTIILDETNGIIEIANNGQSGDFYNIQGMKVKTPNRGIYIRNGKKQTMK